jgi:ribosome-associated translation inhibitor RaiA
MTTKIKVCGVHIPVTKSIRDYVIKNLQSLYQRYDPVSVSLTFKEDGGKMSVVLKYKDSIVEQTIKKDGPELYSLIRESTHTLSRVVVSGHQKVKSKHQRTRPWVSLDEEEPDNVLHQ